MDRALDVNDAAAIKAFWQRGGRFSVPDQNDVQPPTRIAMVPVTLRCRPEVVEYFKGTGDGWQTRMNDALQEYIQRHRRRQQVQIPSAADPSAPGEPVKSSIAGWSRPLP